MKILHFVGGELTGGAARGAYWLHKGLIRHGVDSKIFTNSKEHFGDPTVVSCVGSPVRRIRNIIRLKLDSLVYSVYRNRMNVTFSSGLFGLDITKTPLYEWADVIHLHWISGLVNIRQLSKIEKPVIWTMRDMWPMTGGCHYTLPGDCYRYREKCFRCPQLRGSWNFDVSTLVQQKKAKNLPKNLHVVGISSWLSECARGSKIFKQSRVSTISNCIDTDEFKPIQRDIARSLLDLPKDRKIVLAGAQHNSCNYKGFSYITKLQRALSSEGLFFVFFGNSNEREMGVDRGSCKSFRFLRDSISLRLLYSAADVFIAPSIVEAFGKTLAEAMSCGTPVVCFDATGPRDIVDHEINGYRAKAFETADLIHGVRWVLTHSNYEALCLNARAKVESKFDHFVIAEEYLSLYEKSLENSKS
jgi:glycosyltransferase involved in cell wall biosynthesis